MSIYTQQRKVHGVFSLHFSEYHFLSQHEPLQCIVTTHVVIDVIFHTMVVAIILWGFTPHTEQIK